MVKENTVDSNTYITDLITGEDTYMDIKTDEGKGRRLQITLSGDDYPSVVIESYDGVVRALIYDSDNPDIEPQISAIGISGSW